MLPNLKTCIAIISGVMGAFTLAAALFLVMQTQPYLAWFAFWVGAVLITTCVLTSW